MRIEFKLCNMIFPPYIEFLFTPLVFLPIIGNFIIDGLLVLVITFILFKRFHKDFYIRTVFVAYGLGFAADFVGLIFCFIPELANGVYILLSERLFYHFDFIHYDFVEHFFLFDKSLFIVIGFVVAIICLFFYHFFLTFGVINRRYRIKKWQRIIFSAMLAVFTAPITYFVPYEWIKGFLY